MQAFRSKLSQRLRRCGLCSAGSNGPIPRNIREDGHDGMPARFRDRSYTMAISRSVPLTLADGLVLDEEASSSSSSPLSIELAKEQHDQYLSALRKIVPTLNLPTMDHLPDCVFVEDTAVAIGNRVVLTQMGHESRRPEVESMKLVLEQLGMEILDMRPGAHDDSFSSSQPTCDGGDVLFTGTDLFVGLSSRTNEAGFEFLKGAFARNESIQVTAIPLPKGSPLHLKSIVTHLDEATLLAPTGPLGDDILSVINNKNNGNKLYDSIRLPNQLACNVVVVNGTILAQDGGCMESRGILEIACESRRLNLVWLSASEVAKVDGALTCCSILLDI